MEDLGYGVDYSAQETYSSADLNPNCTCSGPIRQRRGVRSLTASSSSSSSKSASRRLGNDAYQSAVQAGRHILAQSGDGSSFAVPPGLDYVAHQHVSVVVQDGDAMFVVDVHRGD
jgi:ribosomal protein L27